MVIMPLIEQTPLLTLCTQLHDAGIWLSLDSDNALLVGPTALVKKHPALLTAIRERKQELLRLLEDCCTHDLYGARADDPRFAKEECPECHEQYPIILSPRRLEPHRLPGGTQVCPGSERAQKDAAGLILATFIDDRCLERQSAIVSWYALRGALERG